MKLLAKSKPVVTVQVNLPWPGLIGHRVIYVGNWGIKKKSLKLLCTLCYMGNNSDQLLENTQIVDKGATNQTTVKQHTRRVKQ